MAVFRVNKVKNYTVMSNYHFKDKNLSLKAKGLLSQMLSLPDDWDYTVAGLCAINKESGGAMNSALKELENNGYLKRTKVQNEKGRFDYIYDIYEKPYMEKPHPENPYMDNPVVENSTQLNTYKQNTNKLSTYNKNISKDIDKSSKKYGNDEINEMFEKWNELFGYTPKSSKQNRFAAYNMLRAKDKGKEWLIHTMMILREAQKDKYAGNQVLGISNFADLQQNYDRVWKWGSGKAIRNSINEKVNIKI